MNDFDVVISGGGLVGAALAVGLADQGRHVAVIEARARNADQQPSFDDRTLVVNAASLNILGNLGLLIEDLARVAIEEIDVSRAGRFGHLRLRAEEMGRPCFGAVIVAREMGRNMLEALGRHDLITEFCPASLASFERHEDVVRIELADGRELGARLLVGADGNASRVRELAGLESSMQDYHQSAMIFNARFERPQAGTAWERFTRRGPLALLPQTQGRYGVVWIDQTDAIVQAMNEPDEQLQTRLDQHFARRIGACMRIGKRASYPLSRQRTAWPVSHRCVLVGNAANTVHPVSAQGFNLGLRDAGALLDVLAGADDVGHSALLSAYAGARQADQSATSAYTDTLARAFTNPSSLASLASGLGLVGHAFSPALRQRLMQAAMGFREPVCRMARDHHP